MVIKGRKLRPIRSKYVNYVRLLLIWIGKAIQIQIKNVENYHKLRPNIAILLGHKGLKTILTKNNYLG
jgi:hypothetical protein